MFLELERQKGIMNIRYTRYSRYGKTMPRAFIVAFIVAIVNI